MFTSLERSAGKQPKILAASLLTHALVFAWLLHSHEPRLLSPSSIALGHNGRVLARLYFPSQTPDDSTHSSPDSASEKYRHQRMGRTKLTYKPSQQTAKLALPKAVLPQEDDAKIATLSKSGHGATAGALYGSLPGGPIYGDEIRPALPIETSDPVVYPWERPDSEGKVVIEITIDERGDIVRKTVLQSMGSEIDNKCLAALEKWRFQPATQNGLPIASKQDAIFPFKPRGVSQDWVGRNRAPRPAIIEM